jgi:hypothetical protein
MKQLSLFYNICCCGMDYNSCTKPNKDCPEFQKHKQESHLNFLKSQEANKKQKTKDQ